MVKMIRHPTIQTLCEAGHCSDPATLDLGRWERRSGLVGEIRFLCDKHGRAFHPDTVKANDARRAARKAGRCPTCGGALVGTYPTNSCPTCD